MTQATLVHVDAKSAAAKAAVSGEQRKRAGQDAALEAEKQAWVDRFVFLTRVYLTGLPVGAKFAFEDLRAAAAACGHPAPHSPNVWGSMPRALIAAGLRMKPTGEYRKAHSPGTHAHPVAMYVKTGSAAV